MMPSSALATWTVVVVAYLCSQDVYAVVVTTKFKVVTDPSTTEVILPCEYKLENPNQISNIRWDHRGHAVIVKDSLNQIFYGDRYRDRVYWGDGCSLILRNPGLNDTGIYTFRALAPYDKKKEDLSHTKLIVEETSTRETTTAEVMTSASQSAEPNTVPPEIGYSSPVWGYGLSIPAAMIGVIALVSGAVVLSHLQRHGATDIRLRVSLGISISLLIVGVITAVVGIFLRHAVNVTGIVSASFVCLGVVLHIISTCWIIKAKAHFIGTADREHQGKDGDKIHQDLGETLLLEESRSENYEREVQETIPKEEP